MRRISFAIFALFVLITIGANSSVQASGMYTESISINGTNDVKYEYIQHEPPTKTEEEDSNTKQNTYIYVKPYQYTTWSHYPRYNYNHYNPYGNQVVYTYNITGIKTGPDGRMITPLMEREMHDYYYPPMPPPHLIHRGHHPIHRPIYPMHFRY